MSVLLSLLLLIGLAGLSCRSSSEPEGERGISLTLDVVPLLLKADSASVATVWATILEDGSPVADSTMVSFAASLGAIDPESYTRDGLARAAYTPGEETGVAAIIAQARGVRDTVLVTLF